MQRDKDRSEKRAWRILGILLIALSVFLAISLMTYSETDPQGLFSSGTPVSNLGGRLGAYVSHHLYTLFTYSALLVPLALLLWGWNRLRCAPAGRLSRYTALLIVLGFLFCFWAGAVTSSAAATPVRPGGTVGQSLSALSFQYIGRAGTYILLAAASVILLLFTVETPIARVGDWVQRRRAISAMKRADEKLKKQEAQERRMKQEEIKKEKKEKKKHGKADISPNEPRIKEKPKVPTSTPTKEPAPIKGHAGYVFPTLDLLSDPPEKEDRLDKSALERSATVLETKLSDFGIEAKVVQINPGPVITQYELEPAPGVKVSQIANLSDDLALAMKAKSIRIMAPIPGRGTVGIEIPNAQPSLVSLKEILSSQEFSANKSKLAIALGKTIAGEPYATNLAKMPHLLIAGATGSGKSVCINSIICSILLNQTHPQDVQFLMVDPKMLELPLYNGIPHLTKRVITQAEEASDTLKLVVNEMENRYRQLAKIGVRDIDAYNDRVKSRDFKPPADTDQSFGPLPYYVVIVDELADLMLSSYADDIERSLTRLAQMARAVGIHLVLATQRPSVDVITGLIKANFPTRIAFQVASKIDSRTILDGNGAERLLGAGDMLFLTPRFREPVRIHGSYISTKETEDIVTFIKDQGFTFEKPKLPELSQVEKEAMLLEIDGKDELFEKARELVIRHQQGSVSLLQRRLGIGYARAGRIMDQLEQAGVVGAFVGSKVREVLIDRDEPEGSRE